MFLLLPINSCLQPIGIFIWGCDGAFFFKRPHGFQQSSHASAIVVVKVRHIQKIEIVCKLSRAANMYALRSTIQKEGKALQCSRYCQGFNLNCRNTQALEMWKRCTEIKVVCMIVQVYLYRCQILVRLAEQLR